MHLRCLDTPQTWTDNKCSKLEPAVEKNKKRKQLKITASVLLASFKNLVRLTTVFKSTSLQPTAFAARRRSVILHAPHLILFNA